MEESRDDDPEDAAAEEGETEAEVVEEGVLIMLADLPAEETGRVREEYKLTHSEKKQLKHERLREQRRLNRKAEKQKRRDKRRQDRGEADGGGQPAAAEADSAGAAKQKENWTAHRPRLVIDMSFDSRLGDKEVRSVANQVQMSYGWMRSKCGRPLELHLTSLTPRMGLALQRHVGYCRWPVGKHEQCYTEVFADEVDNLVYLSPDATDVLMEIDPAMIYIIGGIADTHIQKGLTLRKAQEQGIATACLPLKEFEASQRNVLNVNHVVEIMTAVAETGDWKSALEQSVPKRRAYHHSGIPDDNGSPACSKPPP